MITLIISNYEIKIITKVGKPLDDSGLLLDGVAEIVQKKVKVKKRRIS